MATRIPLSAPGVFLPTFRKQIYNHTVHLSMKKDKCIHYKTHNLTKIMSSMMTYSIIEQDPTPSDTIRQFYKCMNERNLKQLENYISKDCFFEDYSFPNPFNGKKAVLRFLEQLITGMGQNVEFHVAHIYEDGEDLIAGVNWHLEWKNRQVPFTRGCSHYKLTREGERLMIRKAQVFVESPIKPGDFFLILLKMVTSLFDAFPEATEWFFRSQHVIVQVLLKIYCILIVPFISPLFSFYVNLGKLIMRFMSIALQILEYCTKLFTTGQR